MRDAADARTGELNVGDVPRKRGRPAKGDAMTASERQAAYRARHRLVSVTVQLPAELVDGLNQYLRFKDVTKNEVFAKLIRGQLLRKR